MRPTHRGSRSVITSYSIHYTKLYDLWTREPELERLIEVAKDVVLAVEAGLSEKTSHFSRETPPDRNLETLAKFIEAYREDEEAWHSVLKALEAER